MINIKAVLLFLIFTMTLVHSTAAQAGLIRTSDGQRIELDDLPSITETVLEYDDDQLIGAFNVNVSGIGIFDVDFIDQAFNAISNFDIVATTQTVDAFTTALLDQVFVDVSSFLFDDITSLTSGCESSSVCFAFVPTSISASGSAVFAGTAINQSIASLQPDRIGMTAILTSNDLSLASAAVFARFSQAPTRQAGPAFSALQAGFQPPVPQANVQGVPEPSGFLLLGFGLATVALFRRKTGH